MQDTKLSSESGKSKRGIRMPTKRLRIEVMKIDHKMDKIVILYIDSKISAAVMEKRLKPLRKQREELLS